MRKFRKWLENILGISKTEFTGLIILLPLVLFITMLPTIYHHFRKGDMDFTADAKVLDSLMATIEIKNETVDRMEPLKVEKPLRTFDPNQVTSEVLSEMGLEGRVIKNWLKYLDSGGKFKSAIQLKKIYGLTDSIYSALEPWIVIKSSAGEQRQELAKEEKQYDHGRQIAARYVVEPFDINAADTSDFKQIRGIGSVYARRIVNFRAKLGGFISKRQLSEVWGLKDSVIAQLDMVTYIGEPLDLNYLSINELEVSDLAAHPYLSYKQANAIVNYRYQHGTFTSLDELNNIQLLDSLSIVKISPYLKL